MKALFAPFLLASSLALSTPSALQAQPQAYVAAEPSHYLVGSTWLLSADYLLTPSRDAAYTFDILPLWAETPVTITDLSSDPTGHLRVSVELENGTQAYLIVRDLTQLHRQLRTLAPASPLF
ncbi:MAG: hypothetical protein SFY70_11560 [Bacteroidia bacterium]|nr:hypothetical protein [Bacteroidia bacterium]